MGSLELLKQLRTLAHLNGDNMSLRTAKAILNYLIKVGCLKKNPDSYGDFMVFGGGK